jgi:hypothetical protein
LRAALDPTSVKVVIMVRGDDETFLFFSVEVLSISSYTLVFEVFVLPQFKILLFKYILVLPFSLDIGFIQFIFVQTPNNPGSRIFDMANFPYFFNVPTEKC